MPTSEPRKISNRVWIELDPKGTLDERKERAALLSRMLRRLGFDPRPSGDGPVFVREATGRYCFTLDEAGGYVEASDHGHWFNLDYLGREDLPSPLVTDEDIGSVAP
jgi:hypothetical protein